MFSGLECVRILHSPSFSLSDHFPRLLSQQNQTEESQFRYEMELFPKSSFELYVLFNKRVEVAKVNEFIPCTGFTCSMKVTCKSIT